MSTNLVHQARLLQHFSSEALADYERDGGTAGLFVKLHPSAQKLVSSGGNRRHGLNPDAFEEGSDPWRAALDHTHANAAKSPSHQWAHKVVSHALTKIGANGAGEGGGHDRYQVRECTRSYSAAIKALRKIKAHAHADALQSN